MTRRQDFAKSGSLLCSLVLLGVASSAEKAEAQQAGPASQPATPTNREEELQNRVDQLEQRMNELESTTVLSEPETRVKAIQVYVDENGNEHDEPGPGRRPSSPTSASASIAARRSARRSKRRSRTRRATAWRVGVDAAIVHAVRQQTHGRQDPSRRRVLRAGVGGPVLHRRPRAEHDVLRRHRRPERLAARRRDSRLTLLNGYTARLGRAERAEPARGVAADRALRSAAGADGRPARPDELLRPQRGRQRREHAVHQRRARQQPDARPSRTAPAWPPSSTRRTASG